MIPHNKPSFDNLEIEAATRVIASGWVAQGEEVKQFEDEFCVYHGLLKGYAVAVSSGSAALYLALWVLEVKNEMIDMPAYACTALQNAVNWSGGKINYLDNDCNSPNVNPNDINKSSSKVAIVQHTYGIPVDVTKIKEKVFIEDCCQSLGAEIHGQKVGLFGKVSVFSFYATKLITSGGQGGMVMSKDKALIDRIRDFRDFDQKNDGQSRFNFQMTDLQAAIGRVQLRKLNGFLTRREKLFQQYSQSGINLIDGKLSFIRSVRYRGIFLVSNENKLQALIDVFRKNQFQVINPFTSKELLCAKKTVPNAYAFSTKTISIPIYPCLTLKNSNSIIGVLKNYLG